MAKYIVKRLLYLIPIMLVISLLVYYMMTLTGDPVATMVGGEVTEEEMEIIRENLGLNDPFFVRYGRYISDVLHGDFGKTLAGEDVLGLFLDRLPYTLALAAAGIVIAVAFAVPFGIIAAVKHNTWIDSIVSAVSVVGLSAPGFWIGLEMILLFGVKLGWLPTSGASNPESIIMPAICGGLLCAAMIARMTRSSMLDSLNADYLRTARAKGVSEKKVVLEHAFKNAQIPIITTIGSMLTTLIGGTVVIENVFSWPGIGSLLIPSVRGNEYTLVTGFVLLMTLIVAIVLLAVDILYAYVDPRIKASYTGK